MNFFTKIFNNFFGMNKIQEGNSDIKNHIEEELKDKGFQHRRGPRINKVTQLQEVYTEKNRVCLRFKDGSTIPFRKLNDEYLKLQPGQTPANFLEKDPPKTPVIKSTEIDDVQISNTPVPAKNESPLRGLLKMQEENIVGINIKLKINLPPKELYDILLKSYPNAKEEILDFAVSSIDINNIKESIKEAIEKNYNKDGK